MTRWLNFVRFFGLLSGSIKSRSAPEANLVFRYVRSLHPSRESLEEKLKVRPLPVRFRNCAFRALSLGGRI